MNPQTVPDAVFRTRVRQSDGSFNWQDLTSAELFSGRRVVLFAVPGAFTPACSETHLPGYEGAYDALRDLGIDEVICLSVNDAFVMFQWAKSLGVEKVFMLPDGNGEFTRKMGMLVERMGQGMGMRSWRYSMLVEDGRISALFSEQGFGDNPPGVPVVVSGAQIMLDHLRNAG